MNHLKYSKRRISSRRGSALVLATGLIFLLAVFGALAINMAYMEMATTQLHVSSDAVARAAGRTFIVTGDKGKAIEAAKKIGQLNRVAQNPLVINSEDIVFGKSVRESSTSRYSFSENSQPNAVQVTARRVSGNGNSSLRLPLPGIFSLDEVTMQRRSISSQVDVDIALVVDRSGSMAYAANEKAAFPPFPKSSPPGWNFGMAVPPGSRWLDLDGAVNTFAKELSATPIDTRLAIVSYSDSAALETSLTDKIIDAPKSLAKYKAAFHSGATNIGAGLQAGGNALKAGAPGSRTGAVKVILLMTDGIRTAGSDPVPIAQTLAKDGALIFTITFSSEADIKTMQSVAEKGNGQSFHATTAASLENVFKEIVKQLPTLITL
ncbi:MAG: VWA domain-containing protein [Pirellula sp.]